MAKLLSGTRIYGTATVDTFLFVNGTATSTSTTTGALVVTGGVGIGRGLFVGGITTITNATAAGNSVGALQVTGGIYSNDIYTINGIQAGTTGNLLTQHRLLINSASGSGFNLSSVGRGIDSGSFSVLNNILDTGTVANGMMNRFRQSTINSSAAPVTYTNLSTIFIDGAPIVGSPGTNITVRNAWGIYSGGAVGIFNTASSTSTTTGALVVSGGVGVSGDLFANRVFQTGIPIVFNDVSNQADGLTAVFPLVIDQTAVTGIVDNKDLQVVVNGRIIPPCVTEKTFPWINTFINNKGFAVVTTGTTQNLLVIYNAPDLGAQVSVTQLNTSASKQIRSYPYSATTIALGD